MFKGSKKVYAFYLRVATKHIYLHYIETNNIGTVLQNTTNSNYFPMSKHVHRYA